MLIKKRANNRFTKKDTNDWQTCLFFALEINVMFIVFYFSIRSSEM